MNFLKKGNEFIAARPENSVITLPEEGDTDGEVLNTVILGHFLEILVTTPWGNIKSYASRSSSGYKMGDRVGVKFLKYHTYPEEEIYDTLPYLNETETEIN